MRILDSVPKAIVLTTPGVGIRRRPGVRFARRVARQGVRVSSQSAGFGVRSCRRLLASFAVPRPARRAETRDKRACLLRAPRRDHRGSEGHRDVSDTDTKRHTRSNCRAGSGSKPVAAHTQCVRLRPRFALQKTSSQHACMHETTEQVYKHGRIHNQGLVGFRRK